GLWYALDYLRRRGLPLPGAYDDGPGDLVGQGLVFGVPERPEQVEDAGDEAGDPEQPVEEQPQEAEGGADRLAVGEAGEPDAEGSLAVGLAAAPGPDGVDDSPE